MMMRVSCGRAEKLMPLYAAGDLPRGRLSRAVAAHVARCGACAALVEEFRASREWASAADAVPEFGEEFYEGLRASVLDQIKRDTRPAAPSRLAFFPAVFAGRRLALAASLALAACALALAFYFLSGTRRPQRNDIAVASPEGELVNPPQRTSAAPPPDDGVNEQRPSHDTPRHDEQPAQPNGGRGGGNFKRTPTLRRRSPGHRSSPPPAARAPQLATTSGSGQRAVAPTAPRAETASVARIEIQTADPNIRIIWLAPDQGDGHEPDTDKPDR